MDISRRSFVVGAAAALLAPRLAAGAVVGAGKAAMRDYPVQPVAFTDVHFHDVFWAPRIETNRAVTIPYAFGKCEETGRVANFVHAAETLRGEDPTGKPIPGYPFDDTDLYKILEGASYALSVRPDPKMDAYLDSLIVKIAAAQEPDGYLYTARTINPAHPHPWSGPERWVNEEKLSHELYDQGHLYEAAAAHYQATGKRSLLHIALKSADLLDRTFGPGKRTIWPGHEIVEMGLVKLYRVTGEPRYLALAKFFLDARGPGGGDYAQAQEKVVDQTQAVGHAVRAAYLYSGMADVAALTGDASYLHAIDKISENVVGTKLYLTGGIGARHDGEAFGADYELPNATAYCETCAAVGNVYWNQRLFLLHGDARYVDVLERTLYNGLISGVSLEGKSFFYPNPLEDDGHYSRSPWFGCACCPGNITRFLASVPGYAYAHDGDTLYVNLFAAGTAHLTLAGRHQVTLTQETRYPWDGAVKITVSPDKAARFAVHVRVPGWARGEAVPGGLYRFADTEFADTEFADTEFADAETATGATLSVNGHSVPVTLSHGYARLLRTWKPGDEITLTLPMPVRRVIAADAVAADRGRVALQRGPVVYCAEAVDNPGISIREMSLPDDTHLTATFQPDLLNGVTAIQAGSLTVIPYATWANRGPGEMTVWLTRPA